VCDQSAEQQRDGLSGRQELAMSTLRCRRGLPYEAKSLPSGEEREYHVRVGVPNRKFWLIASWPPSDYFDCGYNLVHSSLATNQHGVTQRLPTSPKIAATIAASAPAGAR